MAHAPGWIELYGILEAGGEPPLALLEQCRSNRNGIGETMLHWYAIEGSADVLQKLVDLGFDVDTPDESSTRPILHAAQIGRWDNVRVLRRAGAITRGVTPCGTTYRGMVGRAGDAVPADLRRDAYQLAELLLPDGPEDTAVMELRIARADAGDGGVPLTRANWERYLAAHPEVDPLRFVFDDGSAAARPPSVVVVFPDPEQRRQAHAIAVHFGAGVEWEFDVP